MTSFLNLLWQRRLRALAISARLLFAVMLLPAFLGGRAQDPATNTGPGPVKGQHVTVEMISAGPEVAAGGTQTVGFVFTLEDKWHIYWKNAGFAGFPPSVKWKLPRDIKAGDLQFPAPSRLPFQGATDYGYEDNVTYPVMVSASPSAKPDKAGNVHLAAGVHWLVCREVCVPGNADLSLDLKLAPLGTNVSTEGTKAGPLAAALQHLPSAPRNGFSAHAVSNGSNIALTFLTGTKETDADFYPLDENLLDDSADQAVDSLPNGVRVHLTLAPKVTAPKTIHGVVELSGDEAYEITADVVPGPASAVQVSGPAGNGSQGADKLTIIPAILLALLGGIVLNLMPCVFPVLFLKALSLVQSSGEERQRLRIHGLYYTLGIVVSFWVIVAVLLALRSGGNQFGWGFQLQSPGFVAVLALMLFFFALSLAGIFEFGLSMMSTGDSLTRKQGFAGSFFTGVLATVVATPCVGPFMAAAIGFALQQPAIVTFVVFTALGLGLALPYLAISFFPTLMRWLPKPGAWMEVLKQVTALPLLATVIWLTYIYGLLYSGGPLGQSNYQMAVLLTAMLVLAIAAWVLGKWPASRPATLVAALLVVAAVAIPFAARPSKAEIAAQAASGAASIGKTASAKGWQPFTQAALETARGTGRPVFVDFTAAWCLSCQVNEKAVLDTDVIQAALKKGNFMLMRADWTQSDPAITAALASLGRSGVPTYVIYPGAAGASPDVLPELLTKSAVLDAIGKDSR